MGGIWEASWRHLGLQEAMGLQQAPNQKNQCLSRLKCKRLMNMLILQYIFEGRCHEVCERAALEIRGSRPWSTVHMKAHKKDR